MQYSSLVFDTQTSKVHAKYKSMSSYGHTNPCSASYKRSNWLGSNLGQDVKKRNIYLNFGGRKKETNK
jgi:hypothetical protein